MPVLSPSALSAGTYWHHALASALRERLRAVCYVMGVSPCARRPVSVWRPVSGAWRLARGSFDRGLAARERAACGAGNCRRYRTGTPGKGRAGGNVAYESRA